MSERLQEFIFSQPSPERLDKFLTTLLPEYSRTRIQDFIKEERVMVDGEIIPKAGYRLQPGQTIKISLPIIKPAILQPEAIPLDIIFENADLIVINKPAGMVVHPSAGHYRSTLVHAALAHSPEMEGVGSEQRPGIVHRLDKDTSGLILIAKNDRSHRWLQDQFRLRRVRKEYLALVDGHPPTPNGRIEAPIGRDPVHRNKMAVLPAGKGREAVSEYFTLHVYEKYTFLKIHILTGRTHQIRLHLAFIGCPVVGDTVYGKKTTLPINRHFLHATLIEIRLPGETTPNRFISPLPADLQQILDSLQ